MLDSPATPHGYSRSRAELERKSDLCSSVLGQAEKRAVAAPGSPLFVRLAHRAIDLLDEIDEILVSLHLDRQHGAVLRAAELHGRLEAVLSHVPSPLRSNLRG